MITEFLAAMRAMPRIVDALERLGDVGTAIAAQQRKDEKDEKVDDLIAAARSRRKQRLLEREAGRVSGDCRETSVGDGGGNSNG